MLTVAELLAMPVPDALEAIACVLAERPELARRFAPVTTSSPVAAGAPVLMRRAAYAARASISARSLDRLLPPPCWAGRGRLRRVVVSAADAFLASSPEREPAESSGPESDVQLAARRAARGGR